MDALVERERRVEDDAGHRVVSVEPDARAHAAFTHNRHAHRCNVGLFRGTIGRTPQVLNINARRHAANKTYDRTTRDAHEP